jgi:2-oxoglutarate ferredoxin oxidoreductase subunit beta
MNREDIVCPENLIYSKPDIMNENYMHYCPGCSHGVVHKIIAEVIKELGLQEKTIGIAPVGCAVFAYNYLDIDWQEAAHGRAPAVATATKRLLPDKMVFTYQGDGDLAAIGTAETIHTANRGENIAIIFINNAIYGMTGGQMFVLTGAGWGHGVGLCQIGAAMMADKGYKYKEILLHYFPGSNIKTEY